MSFTIVPADVDDPAPLQTLVHAVGTMGKPEQVYRLKGVIDRIRSGVSKTRLSILYYGINNACLKISEQSLHLVTLFDETLPKETKGHPSAPDATH